MDADQANTSQNIRKREVTQVPEKQTSSPLPIRTTSNGAVHTRTGTDLESQKRIGGFKGWVQALLHPNKAKPSKAPPLRTCLWNIMKYSWLNLLLAFIPVSWAMHFAHLSDTVIFVFSFLAIIPLASLLGFATEELALRVGPTLGGLLNATFGNAVELIIAIIALTKNQLRIVQASMLGSFLSNCLLVLGMCFFAGGLRFHEQTYGARIAQQQISLLSLSVFSVVVPAAFVQAGSTADSDDVLKISRATAVVLLICYAAYLVFQLHTHAYLYTLEASKVYARDPYSKPDEDNIRPDPTHGVFHVPSVLRHDHHAENPAPAEGSQETAAVDNAVANKKDDGDKEEEEEEDPKLTVIVAILLLVIVTVITGVTAEFLVSSINGMTTTSHVNTEFVALILLPLVGNAAEHVTAVTVSVKNKLDLAMGVAIGSSLQIFLFVLPFMVVLAWGLDKPLTLDFDIFETVIVTLAIIVVNYAIADGRTNWLEGFVLMVLYIIIATATWFHKATGLDT